MEICRPAVEIVLKEIGLVMSPGVSMEGKRKKTNTYIFLVRKPLVKRSLRRPI
jgi:hypothetical protein